jgi:hypothetical protein
MSGRSRFILSGKQVGNPLMNKPDQPERDGVGMARRAALETNSKHTPLAVDFRQFADVGNASFWRKIHPWLPRSVAHERFEKQRRVDINCKPVNALDCLNPFGNRPTVAF